MNAYILQFVQAYLIIALKAYRFQVVASSVYLLSYHIYREVFLFDANVK